MSITTASKLLSFGVLEMPSKEITLKCGEKVKIQALDGQKRIQNADAPLALQVHVILEHGLLEPKLSPEQCADLVKLNYPAALQIFNEVIKLNAELDTTISKAREDAAKN